MVRIQRIRLADGVPIAFEDAALLVDHAAVLDRDLCAGSLHGALHELGVMATSATGTSPPAWPPAPSADCSRPRLTAALLVEARLLFDQHGRPFERTESRYVADRYVIDVVHTAK